MEQDYVHAEKWIILYATCGDCRGVSGSNSDMDKEIKDDFFRKSFDLFDVTLFKGHFHFCCVAHLTFDILNIFSNQETSGYSVNFSSAIICIILEEISSHNSFGNIETLELAHVCIGWFVGLLGFMVYQTL